MSERGKREVFLSTCSTCVCITGVASGTEIAAESVVDAVDDPVMTVTRPLDSANVSQLIDG